MRNRKGLIAVVATASLLVLTACSQGTDTPPADSTTTPTDTGSPPEPAGDAPAPFDEDGVRIAIVQNSGQGDYFQQFLNGTKLQAQTLGADLDVYDAQGDDATQATQLDQAIASGVDGIIVRHGFPDTLCPGVNDALDKGIPVVIYDVEIQKCAPDAVQTQQSDREMASVALDKMAEDIGTGVDVGYVNVLGIAPLDRRHVVWGEYKEKNDWTELFFTGTYTNSSATDTAPMVVAAVQANPGIKAIYAPYDELTKGTLSALEQLGRTDVLVYGADISAADIELMTAEGSQWIATGATDPNAIGAAVTRTLFRFMAGEIEKGSTVDFPPIQITQDFLRDNGIKNMDDLRAAEPALNISDVSGADWIPSVTF